MTTDEVSDPDLVRIAGGEVTLGIGVSLAELRRHAPRGGARNRRRWFASWRVGTR